MRIIAKNFGPIKEADFEVYPFTILIGKNNLGKSYLAQLIQVAYSISLLTIRRGQLISDKGHYRDMEGVKKILFRARQERKSISDTIDDVISYVVEIYNDMILRNLKSILEETYGVPISELRNARSRSSHIEFYMSDITIISFIIRSKDRIDLDVKINHNTIKDNIIEMIKERKLNLRDLRRTTDIESILIKIKSLIFPSQTYIRPYYIPAGRAGLLEGLDSVARAIMGLSTVGAIRGISIPPVSGTTSQFYNIFVNILSRPGPRFYYFPESREIRKIVRTINEVMQGDILLVEDSEKTGVRKIVYSFKTDGKKKNIDVIHAASMVKELTPIYLIMRDFAHKGACIIIEEPESHLHPGAQISLLLIFVELVKAGLNIVITTHSDILLRKLSNLISNYFVKDKKNNFFINPDSIEICWLKENVKGSDLEVITIDKYGFDELPTFDDVIKDLYKEERSIQQKLQLEE